MRLSLPFIPWWDSWGGVRVFISIVNPFWAFFPCLIDLRCVILIIAGLVSHVKCRYAAIIIIICVSRRRYMIQGQECPVTQSSQAFWLFEQGSCLGNRLGVPAPYASSRASIVWARTCRMTSSMYRRFLSAFRPRRRKRLCSI